MTELKTLKDLNLHETFDGGTITAKYSDDEAFIYIFDLKEEAIKWLKFYKSINLKKLLDESNKYISSLNVNVNLEEEKKKHDIEQIRRELLKHEGAIDFMKVFFNITEEDLK